MKFPSFLPPLRGRFLAAAAMFAALASSVRADTLPSPSGAAFSRGALFTVAGYAADKPALAGFPVLVRISDNTPAGFAYDQLHSPSTGADLAFVDMDGNGLPFEIDTWDPNGTSLIWVRLPSMENGTQFVMCWGSETSGKTVCSDNPFDGYKGVWHMNSASPADASGSGNGGTAGGSAAVAAGKVGSAVSLPNKSDYIACGQNLPNSDLFSGFTVEGWANLANTSGNHALFGKNVFMSVRANGTSVQITTPGIKDHSNISAGLSAGTWFHWAMTFVPGNNGLKFYVNGANVNTQNASDLGNQNQSGEMWLGRNQWGNDQNFQGFLDEMRLSAGIKSADWIAADYATQNDPAFLTASEAEPYGETAEPVARVAAVSAAYTNATVSAVVSRLGIGADSADVLVEISASDLFANPVWTTNYTVVAEDTREFAVIGLATGTTYHVRATVENDAGADPVVTRAATFTTLVPGAPEGTAEVAVRGLTTLSVTGKATAFGEGATSATMRLEASADASFATLAGVSEEVAATPDAQQTLEVSGLGADTEYRLRLRLVNDWGVETFVALPATATLDGPVDASGITWTFAPDVTKVDVFLDVTAVFDGAVGTARLYCDENAEPASERGERAVSAPAKLAWEEIPFAGDPLHAKAVVVSEVGGAVYTQEWTAVVDHNFKRLRPVKLAPITPSGNAGDSGSVFDGNLTTGIPAATGQYVIGDFAPLLGTDEEAYVSRLVVTHEGNSRYMLETSVDGTNWTAVVGAQDDYHPGTVSYDVGAVANYVKLTFTSSLGNITSLYEIEAYGYVKAKAKKISRYDIATFYAANGNIDRDDKGNVREFGGGDNWGPNPGRRLFDGNFTTYWPWPQAGAGAYIVIDFTKNDGSSDQLQEYFVTEIRVGSNGEKKFSLQYSSDGETWQDIPGATAVAYAGTGTFSVQKTAKKVRYVFTEAKQWNFAMAQGYLAEIEVWGIDPNDAPCDHASLSEWVIGAIPATCTTRAQDSQICRLCGERFLKFTEGSAPLGHDYVTTLAQTGRFSRNKDFPDHRRYGTGSIACSRCDFRLDFPTAIDLVTSRVDNVQICGIKTENIVRFTDLSVSSSNHPEWGPDPINLFNKVWDLSQQYPYWMSASPTGQWIDFRFGTEIALAEVAFSVYNRNYQFQFYDLDEESGDEKWLGELSVVQDDSPEGSRIEEVEMRNPETGRTESIRIVKEVHDGYLVYRVPFYEKTVTHLRVRVSEEEPDSMWGNTGVKVIEIHPWGTVPGASDFPTEKTTIMILR